MVRYDGGNDRMFQFIIEDLHICTQISDYIYRHGGWQQPYFHGIREVVGRIIGRR